MVVWGLGRGDIVIFYLFTSIYKVRFWCLFSGFAEINDNFF